MKFSTAALLSLGIDAASRCRSSHARDPTRYLRHEKNEGDHHSISEAKQRKAKSTECDAYQGKAKGLCVAYCNVINKNSCGGNIASAVGNGRKKESNRCDRIKSNFQKITGEDMMPCEGQSPTSFPTADISDRPTNGPTTQPTMSPADAYTTSEPTLSPTDAPSTSSPTLQPATTPSTTAPSKNPTSPPTSAPISSPTISPTAAPSQHPTTHPSISPTGSPTVNPTSNPTTSPATALPSQNPTSRPTGSPTSSPTVDPTSSPTTSPTAAPSTSAPTAAPVPPSPALLEMVTCQSGNDVLTSWSGSIDDLTGFDSMTTGTFFADGLRIGQYDACCTLGTDELFTERSWLVQSQANQVFQTWFSRPQVGPEISFDFQFADSRSTCRNVMDWRHNRADTANCFAD
mmetsp:Transcript_39525/g.82085  ORF Transcript_39525/g.82085 Transcript_39525/m.82085 type:complete len:402 (-) Transcript_39525:155-1360(-)